ncbi:Translation machinery-associated protein 16 [Lamellibrachia satsuma]|nr:Translation machinery-associated protein 16 [Lamellibrachia satsuma]
MPKDKTKALKTKVVHPNSRQAMQLSRTTFRDMRLQKKQKTKSLKVEVLGEKLKWFQDSLVEEKLVYSREETHELVDRYLHRFDDELDQIEIVNSIKGRSGQQHVSRKHAITMTLEMEKSEYNGPGLEIPDIINGKNLKVFRDWTGEMRFVQNIKTRKLKATDQRALEKKTAQMETSIEETRSSGEVK